LVFEFPQFHGKDFKGDEFLNKLDAFFGKLPKALPYSVELRTKSLLTPEYFSFLRRHGVAHCFNSWTRMPSVGEQLSPEAFTADLVRSSTVCFFVFTLGDRIRALLAVVFVALVPFFMLLCLSAPKGCLFFYVLRTNQTRILPSGSLRVMTLQVFPFIR
jgi:hypothetical protein